MNPEKWSYSSLKQFETCARQYHEIRILRNYKREDTEQSLYGENLHKAADNYVRIQTPLPGEFLFMQPLLDALLKKQGTKHTEYEMALTMNLEPCTWKDPGVWVRGIADLMIIDSTEPVVWLVDYKTGSAKYADTQQLDLLSLLIFAHYPQIQQVNSALAFVVKDLFVKHKRQRSEIDLLWWEYRQRVARIEKAKSTGVWNPTQSGLCRKYCVVRSCEFNGRH